MANGAQLIATRLYEAGCRYAFGIPGGEVLALVDALAEAGIEFRLAKQENAAGFMAEGTYHATGAPGVLLTTLGPGVSSATNVVANAYQDKVPLIFLTGRIDASEELTYSHQIFDHQALMRPITKASLSAVDGAVDVAIDKALAVCLADPPGPVHIDVPISVAKQPQPNPQNPRHCPPARVQPVDDELLEQARHYMASAEKPLVVAGLEVLETQALETLAKLCRKLSLPLVTTYKAKGVLSDDHRLNVGAAGLSPKADKHLHALIAASDLLLLVGYDPIEMRAGWKNLWPSDKPVIDLRTWNDVQYMHNSTLRFVGDLSASLSAICANLNAKPIWPDALPANTKAQLHRDFAPREQYNVANQLTPGLLIETARAVLPNNTVASVDAGAHRILLSQLWTCYHPHSLLQSTGLCTMGCALPLATGFALANPSPPMAVFVGDAGLEMVLGELVTLRDSQRPVIIFVFVDASLALIELKQRNLGMTNLGVDFPKTDFAGVAQALGGVGVDVHNPTELKQAIKDALSEKTFSLLACHLPRKAYDGQI